MRNNKNLPFKSTFIFNFSPHSSSLGIYYFNLFIHFRHNRVKINHFPIRYEHSEKEIGEKRHSHWS